MMPPFAHVCPTAFTAFVVATTMWLSLFGEGHGGGQR
jgi:hypothetical protein